MATGNDLVQYQESETTLSQFRAPEEVLAEATRAAQALTKVIGMKANPVKFNGETYLEFEDWQTCAKFYGCTAKVISTNFVQFGDVRGFEAIAVVLDRNQSIISQAESLCLSDEDNWGMIAKYEWQDELDEHGKKIWVDGPNGKKRPKGKKVQIGEVAKPLFQLKSMAQTRACARALRQVFAWVVVLAGYKPSVAEEMIDAQFGSEQEEKQTKPPVSQPQRASDKRATEVVSGIIQDVKQGKEGALWMHVNDVLVVVDADKVVAEMVAGNHLAVDAVKKASDKVGEFWVTTAVKECQIVQTGEAEDEVQEAAVDEAEVSQEPAVPAAAAPVVESLKELFDAGKVQTGKQMAESGTMSKRDQAWRATVGHDPAKHISYKQGNLLFKITTERQLSDEVVHALLEEEFGVAHRPLIPKDIFSEVLDAFDPDFKFHEKKF